MSTIKVDRYVVEALRFLHPDLRGYEHYFREGKLKEAVTAGFMRVENRLNQIRDSSTAAAAKGVSGASLPYKLFDTDDLKLPYPSLAAGDLQSREGYAKQLKGFFASGVVGSVIPSIMSHTTYLILTKAKRLSCCSGRAICSGRSSDRSDGISASLA